MSSRGKHDGQDVKPESTHGVQEGRRKKSQPAGWVKTECCFGSGCWFKHGCWNEHRTDHYDLWDLENDYECKLISIKATMKIDLRKARLLRKPLRLYDANIARTENTGGQQQVPLSKGAPKQPRKPREERQRNFEEMRAREASEAAEAKANKAAEATEAGSESANEKLRSLEFIARNELSHEELIGAARAINPMIREDHPKNNKHTITKEQTHVLASFAVKAFSRGLAELPNRYL